MSGTVHSGGCQCGAVRFAATGAPVRASICHCRMCQRASGGVFAPLVEFLNADLEWTGTPATFRSSDIAERGFCSGCGTPLFLRDFGSASTDMMIGAFDAPDLLPPEYNYGVESRIGWVDGIAALPGYETGGGPHGDNPVLPKSLQAPQESGR